MYLIFGYGKSCDAGILRKEYWGKAAKISLTDLVLQCSRIMRGVYGLPLKCGCGTVQRSSPTIFWGKQRPPQAATRIEILLRRSTDAGSIVQVDSEALRDIVDNLNQHLVARSEEDEICPFFHTCSSSMVAMHDGIIF